MAIKNHSYVQEFIKFLIKNLTLNNVFNIKSLYLGLTKHIEGLFFYNFYKINFNIGN